MRTIVVLLAFLHTILVTSVAAHPFIIINTHITTVEVQGSRPTPVFFKRQGLLDDLTSAVGSALGLDDGTSTSTSKNAGKATAASTTSASMKTLAPPAVASTSSSDTASSTSTDDDSTSTSTDTSTDSSTTESSSTTQSSTSTQSTSSFSTTTTATPISTSATQSPTSTSLPSKSSDISSGVPPAGIAVAVIMIILILLVTAFLIFKYHPKSQAWWAAREARLFSERSYRDALDGPTSQSGSPNLRQQALGTEVSRRATMLKSFFAPSTAHLGHGQEIKRKPVNWGATNAKGQILDECSDSEKIPMTASAAPMGQIERYSMVAKANTRGSPRSATSVIMELPTPTDSIVPELPASDSNVNRNANRQELDAVGAISPVSLRPKPSLSGMPPVSPLSMHFRGQSNVAVAERELPALPPVPNLPALVHAKRGSDGVFRLK